MTKSRFENPRDAVIRKAGVFQKDLKDFWSDANILKRLNAAIPEGVDRLTAGALKQNDAYQYFNGVIGKLTAKISLKNLSTPFGTLDAREIRAELATLYGSRSTNTMMNTTLGEAVIGFLTTHKSGAVQLYKAAGGDPEQFKNGKFKDVANGSFEKLAKSANAR